MIHKRVLALLSAIATLTLAAAHTNADTIALTNNSFLYDEANDQNSATNGGYVSHFTLAAFPLNTSQSVSDGPDTASSTFLLSNGSLSVDVSHNRGGVSGSFSQSYGTIFFRILPDAAGGLLTYTLGGTYAATDVSSGNPGYVYLSAYLYDQTLGTYLVNSAQQSQSASNQSFTLGQTAGDTFNTLQGSLTGTLIAGHFYEFSYVAAMGAYPDSDSGASATGNITLSFSDSSAPTAAPLPSIASNGTGLLAALATLHLARRALRRAPINT